MTTPIYFDNAATTPLRKEVADKLKLAIEGAFGNPSSTHQFGRKSRSIIEEARKYIAKSLGCTSGELIFTSGGTEADNMALALAVRDLGVQRIISAPTEHHAVLHTAEALAHRSGVELVLLKVNELGEIDPTELENLLSDGIPTLVSLMHGNNEIGNLIDLHLIGNICRRYKAYFHSDTVQTLGHYPFDLSNTPVDFITASAHKFHGPKGVGLLYVNKGVKIGSFIIGGAQEREHRGGTENILGICGLHAALQTADEAMASESEHIKKLKLYLMERLEKAFPGVVYNGLSNQLNRSLNTVLSVGFPMLENDSMFLFNLDLRGIAVSGGSACASGSNQGSHVIAAINPTVNYPIVRFSFSKDNKLEEIDRLIAVLREIVPQPA